MIEDRRWSIHLLTIAVHISERLPAEARESARGYAQAAVKGVGGGVVTCKGAGSCGCLSVPPKVKVLEPPLDARAR